MISQEKDDVYGVNNMYVPEGDEPDTCFNLFSVKML